jgi:hypothetical protein
MRIDALPWATVTYYQIRVRLEVAELVPSQHREVAHEDVYDKLRTAMWPPPRCACQLARLAWRALPLEVR